MFRLSLIYTFVFLISNNSFGTILKTSQSGNWTNASTWTTGVIPSNLDSVLINPGDTVFINSSSASCYFIKNQGVIYFKSASNSITSTISIFNGGEITGTSNGTFETTKLEVLGNSIIGKSNINVTDSLIVSGILDINSSSGSKSIGTLLITGDIINSSNEDLLINGNITNEGNIEFRDGKISFNNNAEIYGDLKLNELSMTNSLIVNDSLSIESKLNGNGEIINKGILLLGMTNGNFLIDSIDCSAAGNELHLIRNGSQEIPKLSNNLFNSIHLNGSGNYKSSQELIGNEINIDNQSSVTFEHRITANKLDVQNNSILETSDYFDLQHITTYNFGLSSSLFLNNNQILTQTIQVGNLEIASGFTLQMNNLDSLFIAGNFEGNGDLVGNPTVIYNGSQRQIIKEMNYENMIYNNSSGDSSIFYGPNTIEYLKVISGELKVGNLNIDSCDIERNGTIQIGGHDPIFGTSVNVKGEILIYSNGAQPQFNNLIIDKNGTFRNNSSCDIQISGNLTVNGSFSGCDGTACDYTFSKTNAYIFGIDTVDIPRLTASKINNSSILKISKAIDIDSLFNHYILILETDTQNLSGVIDLSNDDNTIIFNKNGEQILPPSIKSAHHLRIRNQGDKTLSTDMTINGNLIIEESASLKTDSFQITGNVNSLIQIDSLGAIVLGHNFSERNILFPKYFSSISLHDSSSVYYSSKADQTIAGQPEYGNLIIDDGSIISSVKSIQGDSLIINGNLQLMESSLTLEANEKIIDLSGDWDGPGSLKLTTGKLLIGGDGNADGLLESGTSEVIYNGNQRQRIKIADYFDLTIDKSGDAYTRANKGSLSVSNNTMVKNGTLDFNSEKCEIENLIVDDSVTFSSKIQEKYFEDITINSNGLFLLDYDEEIFFNGNIVCNGELVASKGTITFNDTLSPQSIDGSGTIELSKITLSKKEDTLTIQSSINLQDTLFIKEGKIQLNDVINISNNGFIQGETNEHNISGIGKLSTQTTIINGTYQNIAGLGLSITSPTPMGLTLIERELSPYTLISNESIKRVYNIEPTINNGLNVSIEFNYWDTELNGNDEDELEIFKSSDGGSNWLNQGGVLDAEANTLSLNGITSFSKWSAGSGNLTPLAVELIDFYGKRENNTILLDWEILSEINSAYYQINFSFDGEHFDSLTSLTASNLSNYSFIWENAPNETVFFELIEIETNGTKNRLDTIVVLEEINNQPTAWITGNKIITKNFETGILSLYSNEGRLIFQNETDVSNLPSGKYYINIINAFGEWTFETLKSN